MPIPQRSDPPARALLADVLIERLVRLIVTGELAPGELVNDVDIAMQLGASKTPVREALAHLAALKLATVHRSRGTEIAPLDDGLYAEALEVLRAFGVQTVRYAVGASTARDQRGLLASLGPDDEPSGLQIAGTEGFIDRSIAALRNPRIRRAWVEITPHVHRMWNLQPGHVPSALEANETTELRQTIRDRDGDAAAGVIETWFARNAPARQRSAPATTRTPVRNPTLPEQAFRKIYDAIFDATLEPGEELREDQLGAWLGMSRTPVRHALHRLRDHGLVDLVAGKQARVAQMDPAQINQALMLSGFFNRYALGQQIGSFTELQLAALDDAAGQLRPAQQAEAPEWLADTVWRIFRIITDGMHSELFSEQVQRISYELARMLRPGGSTIETDQMIAVLEQLTRAIRASDPLAVAIIDALYIPTRTNFFQHFRPDA